MVHKPGKIKSPPVPELRLPKLKALGLEAPVQDPRTVLMFRGGESEGYKATETLLF